MFLACLRNLSKENNTISVRNRMVEMSPSGAVYELPTELWIKVYSYLSHGDMQQVRLVCKRWRQIALFPEFLCATKLKITEHNLRDIRMCLEGSHELLQNVQCVELDSVRVDEELRHVLQSIGKRVHILRLLEADAFGCLNGYLPNLQELSVNCLFTSVENKAWEQFNLTDFPKLHTLELACGSNMLQRRHALLQQLTHVPNNKPLLRQLHLQLMCEAEEELLLQVLEAHACTLTQLRINFLCAPRLGLAWRRLCQQLHRLEGIGLCGKCSSEWLETVFSSLPIAAPLQLVDLNGLLQATNVLLRLIAQKWSLTLRHLELMFCVQISDAGLRQLAQLRHNLRMLNLAYCRNVTKRGLLEGIASQRNATLRQLHLSDLQQLDEECICLLAKRLPRLEALSLNNCSNAVTDKALAHIFRYQRRLQSLLLDDCIRITDFGLLGCSEAPYPISRLRGLQILSLRSRSSLSNSAMHALQFRELHTLQLGYYHRISALGIAQLVLNCPMLENLVISSCLMLDDEAILHIAQGLRRLRKLNVSNCLNITERAVDYIVTFCDSLQELTMCGIDSWEVCDMQKRLLDVKPHLKELHL